SVPTMAIAAALVRRVVKGARQMVLEDDAAARSLQDRAASPAKAGCYGNKLLEEELGRELHLAGRPGIARREARIDDHTECAAANLGKPARLAKVRHVEQVERLDAQLQARLS